MRLYVSEMHGAAATGPRDAEVTCILLVDRLTPESAGWFADVRSIVDELIVFVDSARANEATYDLARRIASQMREIAVRGDIHSHLEEMVRACQTEWILRIDGDEQLTPRWFDRKWRSALTLEGPTSYIVPRRWIHPDGGFLCGANWWPDPQLRLFRNDPDAIVFPRMLHEPMIVPGAQGYWPHLAIDHHVLRLFTRAEREAKVARYRQLRPDMPLGHFYLFEGQDVPVCPAEGEWENAQIAPVTAADSAAIQLEAVEVPEAVSARGVFPQRVRLRNESKRELSSASLFPINLSYHWLNAVTREVEVFEGHRTPLTPAVGPGATSDFSINVVAPDVPGSYILQITLVQEFVRWLEDLRPEIVTELTVQVVRARQVKGPSARARSILPLRPTQSSEAMTEVNSFWDGACLSTLEQLCISSFLENGIAYNLYIYDEPAGLPSAVTLRDAAEILPRSRVFRYAAGDFNCGSVAGFSNLFRYTLIERLGGWWVDTDLCCVTPFGSSGPDAFFREATKDGSFYIASSFFRAAPGSAVLRHCLRAFECLDTATVVHGQTGPRLLTEAVLQDGKDAECIAEDLFFPVPWWDYSRLFYDEILSLKQCHTVHFWNSLLDNAQLDKEARYPGGSAYERLKAKYLTPARQAPAASLDCERIGSV